MKKFILSLIFHTIFLIGFLIGLIEVILTEGENYIFAVCMGIGYCASYIVLYTLFSRYTNKFPKNEITIKNFIKLSDLKQNFEIAVTSKNNVYFLNINSREISLDLNGYLFKETYIYSFLSRNLRYLYVSGKKPLKYLFARRFKIDKNIDISIAFYDQNQNKKIKRLVKNSINKVNFLQNQINRSKYYTYFYSNWSQFQFINKKIRKINEIIYQEGELDITHN